MASSSLPARSGPFSFAGVNPGEVAELLTKELLFRAGLPTDGTQQEQRARLADATGATEKSTCDYVFQGVSARQA